MRDVIFTPEAIDDLRAAFRWYEEQRSGLGARFDQAVDAALTRIVHMPEGAPEVAPSFRRVAVRRFPYDIYYSVIPEAVLVVLVQHMSRDPAATMRRLGRH